jgi:hypothetical protein
MATDWIMSTIVTTATTKLLSCSTRPGSWPWSTAASRSSTPSSPRSSTCATCSRSSTATSRRSRRSPRATSSRARRCSRPASPRHPGGDRLPRQPGRARQRPGEDRRAHRPLREIVDKALDWLIAQALRLGQAALNALGLGKKEKPAETPAGDGKWIYEHPEGGHTIRISPTLEVFQFSDPTALTGVQAAAQKQAALESVVPRTPFAYPADGLGRADGPSGFAERIKENEARASLPAVHNLPGGIAAYEPGDVRGHLIGDRFEGQPSGTNLVPMHTTLNGSAFLSYETQVANAYKAAKTTGGAALLEMSIKPHYPADDPAMPGAKFRPGSITPTCTVYSLDPAQGSLKAAKQTFSTTLTNPSDAVVHINLNTASREEILAAYKGTITPDVHRLVDAILAVRPRREVDFFMLALGEVLGTKLDLFEQMIGSRGTRFFVG